MRPIFHLAKLFSKSNSYIIKQSKEPHSAVQCVCARVRERFMWNPFRSKSCSALSAFTRFALANGADGEKQRERGGEQKRDEFQELQGRTHDQREMQKR